MRLKINKLVKQNLLHKNTWIVIGSPILQHVYSRLVSSDLVNVQAIDPPNGEVFHNTYNISLDTAVSNDFTNIWVNSSRYTPITITSPLEEALEEIRNLRAAQDHQARMLEELHNQLQQREPIEIRQARITNDLIAQASRNARMSRLFNGTHDRY